MIRNVRRKNELFAFGVVVFLVVIFPASLLGYQSARSSAPGVRTIDIAARMPDDGGFVPDVIRVNRGERVRLRLSAPDVVHGFEIPALGVSVPEIHPGQVVEVAFTPEQVGKFAFACTRWCTAGHWRMRGVIEVTDPADPGALARLPRPEAPLYQKLGLEQGKLLRGGMGTGVPEFGSLYSLDDQWAVIAFVRGFMMKD